ncbi:MAG: hypothetical protein NTV88_03105 [Candidatus Micrarchaeota archaeon]|nr:hypothetical protein [Candidatus Micrarchaeota archaeon]
MILVFEAPIADKAKLTAFLEADPYGKPSFTRNGYKVKDGTTAGEDKAKAYIYLKATDEFVKFAKEKLAGLAVESAPEVRDRIAKKIEDEESNAEVGFGSIFGD